MSMAKRARRSVWELEGVEYNADAPSVKRSRRTERRFRVTLTLLAFVAVPLAVLAALATLAAATTPPASTDPSAASRAVNDSIGKAAAVTAVDSWLASTPSPLPGGQIISWDGYTVEDPPAPTDSSTTATAYHFETHTFTALRAGALFTVTVQVAVDGAAATVTASPSLTPLANATVPGTIATWFGYSTTTPSANVSDAVSAWAKAFTSGDPGALRRAVADKDESHSYVPLAGVSSIANVNVVTSGYRPVQGQTAPPSTVIVRAQLSIWWTGQQQPTTGGQSTPTPISYDLLVQDADTASPIVVAWGGPGTGPALQAYGNALTGVTITSTPAPTSDGGN